VAGALALYLKTVADSRSSPSPTTSAISMFGSVGCAASIVVTKRPLR
jgi:hypothetical protein